MHCVYELYGFYRHVSGCLCPLSLMLKCKFLLHRWLVWIGSCLSVCLWRKCIGCIIANLDFKFRSHFTRHCGRRTARCAACGRIISRHASQCKTLFFKDRSEANYLRIYWTDFHDFISHQNGSYLFVADRSWTSFFWFLKGRCHGEIGKWPSFGRLGFRNGLEYSTLKSDKVLTSSKIAIVWYRMLNVHLLEFGCYRNRF